MEEHSEQSTTTISLQSSTCPLCLVDVIEDHTRNFCPDSSHGSICNECVGQYIHHKVEDGFMGICPKIGCPLPHSDGKKRVFCFSKWSTDVTIVPQATTTKFKALANSVLAFLCGGCHSLKSLSVSATSLSPAQVAEARENLNKAITSANTESHAELFQTHLHQYCSGEVDVDTVYTLILNEYLPVLTSADDRTAWNLFKNILILIEDPELQVSLHLRYLRSRPRMWTPCCDREHCFRCKTKDFHNGKTCDENTASLDGSIVNCPACGVAIAKGDGCNTVTCVCSKQFSWSTEKDFQERSNRFSATYPSRTAHHCVEILCRQDATETDSTVRDAQAWQTRNPVEINRELLSWWSTFYGACPAQACAVVNVATMPAGIKDAVKLWTTRHQKEVEVCKQRNTDAVRSVFKSLYPNDRLRTHAAVSIIHSKEASQTCYKTKNARLLKSVEMWVEENRPMYENALRAKQESLENQFLYLHGHRCVGELNELESDIPSVCQWSRALSNTALAFSNEDMTVQRPGGASSYPVAVAELISERCMISVRVDSAPSTSNWLTFGLSNRHFPNQGSDGIGRTTGSWGINDDRSATRDARISAEGRDLANCRKFRVGDILKAVVDVAEGWLDVSINDTEVQQRIDIPVGRPEGYLFAMSFANDHRVTIQSEGCLTALVGSDSAMERRMSTDQARMLTALKRKIKQVVTSTASSSTSSPTSLPSVSLSPSPFYRADVGSRVVLTPNYQDFSDAGRGPLHPDDIGEVVEDRGDRLNVRLVDDVTSVRSRPDRRVGATWWYDRDALTCAPHAPHVPEFNFVSDQNRYLESKSVAWGSKFSSDSDALIAVEKLMPIIDKILGRNQPREVAKKSGGEAASEGVGAGSVEKAAKKGAKMGGVKTSEDVAIALRDYLLEKQKGSVELDAANSWRLFQESHPWVKRVTGICKAKQFVMRYPQYVQWDVPAPVGKVQKVGTAPATAAPSTPRHRSNPSTHKAVAVPAYIANGRAWIRPATPRELQPSNSYPITWNDLVSAVCWKRLRDDQVSAAERAEMDMALSVAFLGEHGEAAPFMAAMTLADCNVKEAPAEVRREAEAFVAQFPDEMQEWYAYNASLEEPMFGLERADPACRCLPRHVAVCPAIRR